MRSLWKDPVAALLSASMPKLPTTAPLADMPVSLAMLAPPVRTA